MMRAYQSNPFFDDLPFLILVYQIILSLCPPFRTGGEGEIVEWFASGNADYTDLRRFLRDLVRWGRPPKMGK